MCAARVLDGPGTVARPFAGLTPQEVSAGLRRGNENPSFSLAVPRGAGGARVRVQRPRSRTDELRREDPKLFRLLRMSCSVTLLSLRSVSP